MVSFPIKRSRGTPMVATACRSTVRAPAERSVIPLPAFGLRPAPLACTGYWITIARENRQQHYLLLMPSLAYTKNCGRFWNSGFLIWGHAECSVCSSGEEMRARVCFSLALPLAECCYCSPKDRCSGRILKARPSAHNTSRDFFAPYLSFSASLGEKYLSLVFVSRTVGHAGDMIS